jgi:ribose transport system substrate-binding protein
MNLLPPGGKVAVFVGTMSADNARERLRGVKDALGARGADVLQPKEDGKNDNTARTNVEQVLSGQADVKLLVGLWSYNGPAIADVLGNSARKGEVKAAVFDEEKGTLNAIESGLIACTVVQKPFQFGYQSSKVLHELALQGQPALPKEESIDTGVTVVTSAPTSDKTKNVKEFREELQKLTQ